MNIDVMRLLDAIKCSQWYDIEIDWPADIAMHGRMPFSCVIYPDGRAIIHVLAPDPDSASERVYEWLNSLDDQY